MEIRILLMNHRRVTQKLLSSLLLMEHEHSQDTQLRH